VIDVEAARADAVKLHAKMTERGGDRLFLPTGGAFLSMSPGRIEGIISEKLRLTNEDVFDTYAKWHEGVHMAQLLTSPFVFPIALEMAGLAQRAYRISAGADDQHSLIDDLAKRYQTLCDSLENADGEYSPMDIIETHAVTQGFRWTVPYSDGNALRVLANFFYREKSPSYVRLLNIACEKFGDDVGTILLPRFCFLSLQAAKPTRELLFLFDKLSRESSPDHVVTYEPIQLCEWAGAPVSLVSRSLRERAASFVRNAAGQLVRLTDHPWVGLFAQYFDEFEAVSDSGNRLDLLMGRQGAYAHSQFSPRFTVYPGGDVRIRGTDPNDQSEIAHEARQGFVEMTLNLVSGLEFLHRHVATRHL